MPTFIENRYVLHVLVLIIFYVAYSSSWNILAYSGQVSFGHAAFLGLGGYLTTLIALSMNLLWIGILVGGLAAALAGLLIGIVCVRLREWFLALVTFGFSIILEAITIELDWITAGTMGLAVPKLLPSIQGYYYLMLVLALICIVVMYLLQNSKMGLAFASIRENEEEAKVTGINPTKFKLIAFTLSTFLTGILGSVYVHFIGFVNPQIFHLDFSFWPMIITIIGGMGTLEGPIVGAILFEFIWEFLRVINPLVRLIVIGAIVVLVVILMPKGIVPSVKSKIKQRKPDRR
jgi:branched-chain amino acid transport system permease protein